jgi:hypothetical protein
VGSYCYRKSFDANHMPRRHQGNRLVLVTHIKTLKIVSNFLLFAYH